MLAKYGYKDMHQFRNWRWYKGLGGGPLSDLGAHQIDIFNWWLGTRRNPSSPAAAWTTSKTTTGTTTPWSSTSTRWPRVLRARSTRCRRPPAPGGGYFEMFMGDDGTIKMSEDPSICAIYREARADAVSWDDLAQKGYVRAKQTSADATKVDVRETAQLARVRDSGVLQQTPAPAAPREFLQRHPRNGQVELPGDEAFTSEYVIHKANDAVAAEKRLFITSEEVKA